MVRDPTSETAITVLRYNTRYLIRKSYGSVNQSCVVTDGGKAKYVYMTLHNHIALMMT